ncbi:2B14 protein, partial [Campylorhamphus procurvoides]|nr:2B14 protein [Campylorhamphus procurvoides]
GAPPALSPAHSEVLLRLSKHECHFINGIDRVRYLERQFYNREQLVHFDRDVGHYVGHSPCGEIQARHWNSDPQWMEYKRTVVDTYCRHNYRVDIPFTVNRRVPPSPFQSL